MIITLYPPKITILAVTAADGTLLQVNVSFPADCAVQTIPALPQTSCESAVGATRIVFDDVTPETLTV